MASSLLRSCVLATAVSTAMASSFGAIPTPTFGGFGHPVFPEVTAAPQRELVKARLQKRALTNYCTEWSVPGVGAPSCTNSATCLFTAATDGYFYEGCGETSIAYIWTTECVPYSNAFGNAPLSQTYCGSISSACGYYAFVFGPSATAYNFGCDTTSYSYTVELLETSSSSVIVAGDGGSAVTVAPTTVYLTAGVTGGGSAATESPQNINSHPSKKSTPIGAIVGGVVGGVAVIALVLAIFFCVRSKKRKEALAREQQYNGAPNNSTYNPHQVPEIAGKPAVQQVYSPPPLAGAYAPAPEKQQGAYNIPPQEQTHQSPPPVYAQPAAAGSTRPPSELDPRASVGGGTTTGTPAPVSPMTTGPPTSSELGGDSRVNSPMPPQHAELGGVSRGSYQAPPPNVQEMGSGASTGGINRPPQQQSQARRVDMSGAPISEEYHHELE